MTCESTEAVASSICKKITLIIFELSVPVTTKHLICSRDSLLYLTDSKKQKANKTQLNIFNLSYLSHDFNCYLLGETDDA